MEADGYDRISSVHGKASLTTSTPFFTFFFLVMIAGFSNVLISFSRLQAPEVAQEKPYNYTADVYSFSILLWQLLSLKTPFDRFGVSIFNDLVIEKGFRPDVEKKWPASIQDLIKMCWSKDMKRRLQFEDIVEILRGEINVMSGEDANDIDVSRRTARSG
jgi:serine/threonine protein kinase